MVRAVHCVAPHLRWVGRRLSTGSALRLLLLRRLLLLLRLLLLWSLVRRRRLLVHAQLLLQVLLDGLQLQHHLQRP
jgi:hypothetical protein